MSLMSKFRRRNTVNPKLVEEENATTSARIKRLLKGNTEFFDDDNNVKYEDGVPAVLKQESEREKNGETASMRSRNNAVKSSNSDDYE